ncbi:hypothetical protein CAEBREN_05291 [Caenorhabditis brenneri]|uniref:Uncharacterized protein n=1 Tax=Caenorhabditis brenneri TaxID=135651 RepID=G0NXK7_CAEBE|nr:hypothetical protein CAEBREN_05291 [Caenorhabditis brenneri]
MGKIKKKPRTFFSEILFEHGWP